MKFLRNSSLSPFILTLYAVLSLWVVNYDQTPFYSIIRALALTLVIALISLLIFRLFLRNWVKAGLSSSLALLIFFIYGHIYNLILGKEIAGFMIGRHRYLLLAAGILFGLGLFLIIRQQKKTKEINLWVNVITLILLAVVGVQAGSRLMQLGKANQPTSDAPLASQTTELNSAPIGDVYYIVMDSYSRQDWLLDKFGYDNSQFLNALTEIGFVIPDCTLSNYTGTQFSMSSSLNMNYLDQLNVSISEIPGDPHATDYFGLIRSGNVRRAFEKIGYKIVTFQSQYTFLDIYDADIYYDVDQGQPFYDSVESINFQDLFFRTTLLRVIIEAQESAPEKFAFLSRPILKIINPRLLLFIRPEERLYDQYQFSLSRLRTLPEDPEPKFVYAHLYITHPPFVYNIDGSMRNSFEESNDDYINQIRFSNQQLLEIVQTIIKKSSKPPVIIIQGDHAYQGVNEESNKILNAYYLPLGGNENLYPKITPVNTFRLILSYYFDQDFPLLIDRSYYRKTNADNDKYFYEAEGSCVK